MEQLVGSEDYVVLVLAALGELNEQNKRNHIRKNSALDVTTNVTVQVIPTDQDMALWDYMDQEMFNEILAIADLKESEHEDDVVQYWIEKKAIDGEEVT
jgi:hypothetical protein